MAEPSTHAASSPASASTVSPSNGPGWQAAYHGFRRLRDVFVAPAAWLLVRLSIPAAAISGLGVVFAATTIWTLSVAPKLALAGVAGALLCDLLDGAVARRAGTASSGGKVLDQICDSAMFTALLVAASIHGAATPGLAVYSAYISLMVVVLALAARALAVGERWLSSPQAGFAGHFPKIFLIVAFCARLLGGPNWIDPALLAGNIAATLICAVLVLRVVRGWPKADSIPATTTPATTASSVSTAPSLDSWRSTMPPSVVPSTLPSSVTSSPTRPRIILLWCIATALAAGHVPAEAATGLFVAGADNTLYESVTGSLSNGAGIYCYAGLTTQSELRRAVVRFDLSSIPAGSRITNVSLSLELTLKPAGADPVVMDVHRLTSDWGEGASDAGSPGGQGTTAAPGDATWIHTFSPGVNWSTAGGDFLAAVSTSLLVDEAGFYSWPSTLELVADVQAWIDGGAGNFGWMLRADETTPRSARRFATRENTVDQQPTLTVTYQESIFADGFETSDFDGWTTTVP